MLNIFQKAKQLKQKKEDGNEAFKKGNFQEAYQLYTDALAIDPLNKHTNAKLYFNRATVGSKVSTVLYLIKMFMSNEGKTVLVQNVSII